MASLIRYFPRAGAPEWKQGAACMANDPRGLKPYNSELKFVTRVGSCTVSPQVCVLLPGHPILVATRAIRRGEEIFFKYGSETPFRGV